MLVIVWLCQPIQSAGSSTAARVELNQRGSQRALAAKEHVWVVGLVQTLYAEAAARAREARRADNGSGKWRMLHGKTVHIVAPSETRKCSVRNPQRRSMLARLVMALGGTVRGQLLCC